MTKFVTTKRFEVALALFGVLVFLDIVTLAGMYIFSGVELILIMLGALLCFLTVAAIPVLIAMGLFLKKTNQI